MAKDPRALLQQAEALRKSGRLSDAIDACLKALDTQPGLDALRVTLGRTYLESGQADLAKKTLEEVFARLPEHHLAGKLLAEAQRETGDRGGAETTCVALLAIYPRDREIEALLKTVRDAAPEKVEAAPPAATAPAPAAPAAPTPGPPAQPERVAAPAASGVPRAMPPPAPEPIIDDPLPDYVPEDVAGGAPETTPPRPAVSAPAASSPAASVPAWNAPAPVAPPPAWSSPVVPTATAAAPAEAPAAVTRVATPASAPAPPPRAAAAPVAPVAASMPAPVAMVPPDPAPPRTSGRDALQTNTLAELYVKQGLIDRAVEVYRGMLKVDPANERARRRLAELEAAPAASAPPAPPTPALPLRPAGSARAFADDAASVSAAPRPAPIGRPPAPPAPAAFSDPAAAARAAAIRRLEEWLAMMQSGRQSGGKAGR